MSILNSELTDRIKKQVEEIKTKVTAKDLYPVLYPDGGGNNNTRICGWGVHGYIAKPDAESTEAKKNYVFGYGGFVDVSEIERDDDIPKLSPVVEINAYGGLVDTTSNIGELTALRVALAFAEELIGQGVAKGVSIKQDSLYAINTYKFIDRLAANNWIKQDGKQIVNRDIIEPMFEIKKRLGKRVNISHVKGHSGEPGNDKADMLATAGVALANRGSSESIIDTLILDSTTDTKPKKVDVNPLLKQPVYTFVTNVDNVVPNLKGYKLYTFATLFKETVQGQPHSMSGYSVVAVPNKEPVLELIRERHNTINTTGHDIIEVNTTQVFRPSTYHLINDHQELFLKHNKDGFVDSLTVGGIRISGSFNPPLKAFSTLDIINQLTDILASKIDGSITNNAHIYLNDITDRLFSKGAKGKVKLNPEIAGEKVLDIIAEHTCVGYKPARLKLMFGIDIPDISLLRALVNSDAKVEVGTLRKSDNVFTHFTIVTTSEGSAIFCSCYSGIRVLLS